MIGLTINELVHALTDALALYAPAPPPEHVRALMEAADACAPDPDLEDGSDDEDGGDSEPSLGWTSTMALGEQTGRDLELEHDGREPEWHA